MSNNDFKMDTALQGKKAYLKKIKGILGSAIFLTGVWSLSGVVFFVIGIVDSIWNDIGMAVFMQKSIIYLSGMCVFVALVKIKFDSKPFSKMLTICIKSIGVIFTVSALLIPQFSGYVSSGFDLFSFGSFVLLDGTLLTFGLLLIILSALIKIAFEMQTEMDEVL